MPMEEEEAPSITGFHSTTQVLPVGQTARYTCAAIVFGKFWIQGEVLVVEEPVPIYILLNKTGQKLYFTTILLIHLETVPQ